MIAELAVAAVLWAVPPAPNPAPAIHPENCPTRAHSSCFIDGPAGGDLYVNPALATEAWKMEAREHELGHAYAARQLVDGEQHRITAAMGWKVWHPEGFADFYAGCRLAIDPHLTTLYGKWQGLRSVAARCRLIARAGL